jgi:protein-S-isoprenylcysteine O-methyltransferase Ste14
MGLFLKVIIFTVLVPGTVAVVIPRALLGGGPVRFGAFYLPGFILIAIGASVYMWCVWDFAYRGRGTPAPFDPPVALVATGLYRYVRNPIYIGVLLVLLAESIALESAHLFQYFLAVWVMFHLLVVLYEEPTLGRNFGSAYSQYCKKVGRWIPRRPESRMRVRARP